MVGYFSDVTEQSAVEIHENEVGVRTLLWGKDPREWKGAGGTYYVNPYVEKIVPIDTRSHRVEFAAMDALRAAKTAICKELGIVVESITLADMDMSQKDLAKSSIYKKMDVLQHDGNAYLRSVMAEKLNDKMTLRLYQSGPGTFWTNMGNKNMTLMLPTFGTGSNGKPLGDEKSSTLAK